MNTKLFYPAIFHKAEEGGFWVSFPDLPECLTEGNDMQQAYEMAVDALGLALTSRDKEKQPIPHPSSPDSIPAAEDGFAVIIEINLLAYKKRTSPKAVKKTLSIPEWLNNEAIAANLNFSQVLQDALISKLNLY